ncbi:hypothetical protein DK847_12425 [Aestuariivirga litoralis]|uniref:DUF3726 domain-containing protein n=1 Tax=Aestuariivirga litoralis TaxID=2650924 RepID=A0A2W2AVF6_9HYPH|nr:hypothetical protein [Aestuariivirga litoralis]PZF76600.1 hypothetical protein DK847_12425 [Aestuariivirga litoralis]
MRIDMQTAQAELTKKLGGLPDAADIAWATIWLEACGYSGVKLLGEALKDERRTLDLTRDALGIDLQQVSCAFLAPAIMREVAANGRAFLRNVRHGLYMLPFTVRENIGLGCPVDPSFAVGGERHKNPYVEKLDLAAQEGLEIDDAQWAAI